MSASRLIATTSLICVLTASSVYADEEARNTVGSLVESNGMAKDGWLVVRTPTILSAERSSQLVTDERSAIVNFNALLDLSANDAIRADAMRRVAWLNLRIAQRSLAPRSEQLVTAIVLYERLLKELPDDAENDVTLYQLAHAYQLEGRDDASIDALTRLTASFPHSALVGDAAFRAGELLYSKGRFAEAQAQYSIALDDGGKNLIDPARYKLAWSEYKQGKYSAAVPMAFLALDKYLPPGDLSDPDKSLGAVDGAHAELVADSLRLADLSLIAMGGGDAIGKYFAEAKYEPRFGVLLYASVATMLLVRQRYGDAAAVDAAFVERHPDHPLAPIFLKHQIDALDRGGFVEQEAQAKAQYIAHFEPGASYWHGKKPDAEIMANVHTQIGDLAQYQHARAQALPAASKVERAAAFALAANTYQKLLDDFPDDSKRQEVEMQLGDTLLEADRMDEAARRYDHVAYDFGNSAIASAAALAEVQTYRSEASTMTGDTQHSVLLKSVDASVRLAATFPGHPQKNAVLVRAAQDLHGMGEDARAITVAAPLTDPRAGGVDPASRQQALAVVGDAHFARHEYAAAEASYAALLATAGTLPVERTAVVDQLAASIYRQGEAARDAGDMRTAANAFARVGEVTPDATLRANADYDAGRALVVLKDWSAAETMLEGFRSRFASNRLLPDADRMLADAYYADSKYPKAGLAYQRIATRREEPVAVRVDAAWLAAQSNDRIGDDTRTALAYETYLTFNDGNVRRVIAARERLAQLADTRHDSITQRRWLKSVVDADMAAGVQRDDATRFAAANAVLTLGRLDAADAQRIGLTMPLATSLPRRQKAMQAAASEFNAVAGYGLADTTTAAALDMGVMYRSFADAIQKITPPPGTRADDLNVWHAALVKEAQPFDAKATAALEANVVRSAQGVWNRSVQISAHLLADMNPAVYGKNDEREASDADLR